MDSRFRVSLVAKFGSDWWPSNIYMMLDRMIMARTMQKIRMESGCVDLAMAPVNIWMPVENLPNLKTRKTLISRMTRMNPRPPLPVEFGSIRFKVKVIQKGRHASRSIIFCTFCDSVGARPQTRRSDANVEEEGGGLMLSDGERGARPGRDEETMASGGGEGWRGGSAQTQS